LITLTYRLEYKRDGSGFFEVGVAGDDVIGRKLVHRDNSGVWRLANSADAAKMPSLGITIGAIRNGIYGKILTSGYVGDASWSWIPGLSIFATDTPGELSQIAPTIGNQQVIGYAAESNLLYFLTRQIRGTGSETFYTCEGFLPADQFGKPKTDPPEIVDQDNVTLYAFTLNDDKVTIKFPLPLNYVSGPLSFKVVWTNNGGTDDNGKNVKTQLDYQIAAEGEIIAGSHANSPKTIEDAYASASGWVDHRTGYMNIASTDFELGDCIFLKLSFVTPSGTALSCEPHLIGMCMHYLATPDR